MLLFVVLVPALLLSTGCSKPPVPQQPRKAAAQTEDVLATVRDTVRKGADAGTYRGLAQQLNTYLAQNPAAQPPSLTAEEKELLMRQLGLDPDEQSEIESKQFTLLDAHYLDLCNLMRDAARTIRVEGLPPRDQAASAFGWVTRQIRVHEVSEAPLPPTFTLHRGWGTATDRSLTFLALLEQLGIDGCMIALPGAEAEGPRYWLPGVLVDKHIYLFDPRLGLPLPTADGKGILTLAQARTQPDAFKALQIDDKHHYDVTPEQAKRAEVHLTWSLSALAPRMRVLEKLLGEDRMALGVDPVAALKRFQAATQGPAFEGSTVHIGSRPGDPLDYPRVLRAFLPPQEGGGDRSRRLLSFLGTLVPTNAYPPLLRELPPQSEIEQRLHQEFQMSFLAFSLGPKAPRELSLRGHYDDAKKLLVSQRDLLRPQKTLLESEAKLEEEVIEWCRQAIDAYGELIRHEREAGKPGGPTLSARAEARKRVDELWKKSGKVQILLRGSAAGPLGAEATYLLALCRHEEAEHSRLQKQGQALSAREAENAAQAWQSAASWWQTFLDEYPNAPAAPEARRLRAEALAALGQNAAAVELLRDLSGGLTSLQETARLYRAKQLAAP